MCGVSGDREGVRECVGCRGRGRGLGSVWGVGGEGGG